MDTMKLEPTAPRPEDLLAHTISRLGYPGSDVVSERIAAQIDEGLAVCLRLARPRAICRSTAFTGLGKTAVRGENLCLETVNWSRLAARMSAIQEITCFAVTLGRAIDEEISRLGKAAMLQALMLDAAASALADLLADQIQRQINALHRQQGWQSSARFSPGYCDWPVKEGQQALAPFLQPSSIGIDVSASGLMIPRKSVTAAVIAAETMPAVSPCFLCARDCRHRRAPYVNSES